MEERMRNLWRLLLLAVPTLVLLLGVTSCMGG